MLELWYNYKTELLPDFRISHSGHISQQKLNFKV